MAGIVTAVMILPEEYTTLAAAKANPLQIILKCVRAFSEGTFRSVWLKVILIVVGMAATEPEGGSNWVTKKESSLGLVAEFLATEGRIAVPHPDKISNSRKEKNLTPYQRCFRALT